MFPSRFQDVCDLGDTSQQHNTHLIEWREVRYAWHPWYGRAVAVRKRFARYDRVTFQCSIEADPEARLLEIPEWMFDPAICLRMRRLAAAPTVSCEALLDLKSLLQCTPALTLALCYKLSIAPCYLQEVLMRKSLSQKITQSTLFQPMARGYSLRLHSQCARRARDGRLTREGGGRMVLRRNRVEVGNFGYHATFVAVPSEAPNAHL